MIGQPQSHCRRLLLIATNSLPSRQPQRPMRPMEVVIKQLQTHECIEGGIAFGEGMRLAGESIEPITQSPVEAFNMHRPGWLHPASQCSADLHRQEVPVLIAMLDGLCQGERLWHDQRGTSPFAGAHWLSIGAHQDAPITVPSITEPGERPLVGPLNGGGHRLLKQVLVQGAGGAGDDEATVPVLDQTSPAFSLIRLVSCPLFFCTNDQNSSIST